MFNIHEWLSVGIHFMPAIQLEHEMILGSRDHSFMVLYCKDSVVDARIAVAMKHNSRVRRLKTECNVLRSIVDGRESQLPRLSSRSRCHPNIQSIVLGSQSTHQSWRKGWCSRIHARLQSQADIIHAALVRSCSIFYIFSRICVRRGWEHSRVIRRRNTQTAIL